ncbi:UPF0415 protein C7orf25 homolog [Phoenix dactylifera]|uniref:UPF0415 protein C7orf25 homolog n=1 Tax=Phoenix dactylifera TaxID=42345 RepID=A0A8B7CE41_PHODC|nr:UPF0415 protein C7orf25 homolog [Phoenix dactylifera]XP_008797214.1 UPF0415 protein C7orf25 homolog [Phoenix dactylifera]XP_008797215.1 UPF0415 protein C7orf25 homolog [Phoenix dactylifera]
MHPPTNTSDTTEVRRALARCHALRDRLLHSLPPSKLSPPARLTLLRLVDAELRFLSRLSSSASSHPIPSPLPTNLGYLESIARVLLHPSVLAVSRVCKPLRPSSAHVDVAAILGRAPAWFLVSDRNPHHLPWFGPKGLHARVERVLCAARSAGALAPASVLFVFSRGLADEAASRMAGDFGAVEIDFFGGSDLFEELEEEWVGVRAKESKVFEIKIDSGCGDDGVVPLGVVKDGGELGSGDGVFGSLISKMSPPSRGEPVEVINFDTTALVAMVSGISNGGCERLLKAPEDEMRARFKSNYEFVIAQVMSELQNQILAELEIAVAGKKGIICESVHSEFKELVSMCGGANEKLRAAQLIKCLLVVPDNPSARVMGLPTTRKIALKNKIVFGTGDHWHSPTLTANMGFVRAISQTGLSLSTIEHRPRALTGD